MAVINVDSRGSACPGPVTDLVRAYKKANNGDIIELLATDAGIKADAKAWCERTGNELLGIEESNGEYKVRILIKSKK
ncbi:MAG: sulfurtransferase TusA family protein [Thermoplasmata archaeon]|jgi:TusA-related sulfurtransferase|nr:sulfurtransferase TusA family protein [Thermoplasmata archaeon]